MPEIYLLFPEGKCKALTLSYDDGVEQDVRLMQILDQHGLKCTFNINSNLYAPEGTKYPEGQVHRRMTKSQVMALYPDSGHEIAVHAAQHADLTAIPSSSVVWEVIKDKQQLETQFGRIIRGMAYPFGRFSDDVVSALRSCGIAYARTVHSTCQFDIPIDWLRLPATCHHNHPQLMDLARRFAEQKPVFQPWLFYLWGHSYEFEADHNWHVIEEFAEYLGGREDIWYATNIEIYDYVEAWRSLITSADGLRIYNPTCKKLWIRWHQKVYTIEPGQEIKMQ
ncbi:MAG: polysaccharide deacetylase family protein [Clostridia bacterium]|nr:polysaccharide deacetylase family protein [Clostridia bacterium]